MAASRIALATALLSLAACDGTPPVDAGTDSAFDAAQCDMDATITTDAGACPVLGHNESQCAELIVGNGRDGTFENFQLFAPGDTVYVTPGSQGLQHIYVAVRGRGFDPTNPLVGLRFVRASDCVSVGYLRFRLPFQPDLSDPTLLELQTVRVILLDDADPLQYCSILGQDVILLADLDDARGHRAHQEVRLHVGGIDPTIRPDLIQAWIGACQRGDGGTDAGVTDP